MKTISFFRRTFFFSLLVAMPLLFSHCGGSDDYKQNDDNENINEGTREENQAGETREGSGSNEGNANNREQATGYPEDKVQDNTNLTNNDPLNLNSDEFQSVDKKILLATLNRQKNMIEYHIEALQSDTGSSEVMVNTDNSGANVQQLETQLQKLDQEIAKVRNTSAEELDQVVESAQAAIEEAGALVVSDRMQVQLGF